MAGVMRGSALGLRRGSQGWLQLSLPSCPVPTRRAAPMPQPWLCGWKLFLDRLGPMGTLLPKLWGGPAAPPAGLPAPGARRALVPRHPHRLPGTPLLQPAGLPG